MQFDSQWDTHPDNTDQCCFIKPIKPWCAFRWFSHSSVGGERACIFFPGKKTEKSILGDWNI